MAIIALRIKAGKEHQDQDHTDQDQEERRTSFVE